ncbi:hypothetical protein C8R41DRAFT_920032 [Lentinula lateritia]|uniref:Helicase ATP-binding domain-containing protein n=1 Tax=Lentinula lateritia TaxID=40482 RepID=A0ABQ8VFM4_9AGAR|nr:hypothetical protein C8R41DRAFT_920032 [Lentinula lateritia]
MLVEQQLSSPYHWQTVVSLIIPDTQRHLISDQPTNISTMEQPTNTMHAVLQCEWAQSLNSHDKEINRQVMIATIKAEMYSYLQKYRSGMIDLATNAITTEPWKPNVLVSERTIKAITQLNIPRACAPYSHLPDMLSHRLGRFQDDAKLKQRMHELFGSETHKIFVNTSGAGKTRLVLEHLCSNWGLYLTCHDDSRIGSKDLSIAISNIKASRLFKKSLPPSIQLLVSTQDRPEHAKQSAGRALRDRMEDFESTPEGHTFGRALETNNGLVACELFATLLARLHILHQFLATLVEIGEDITQPMHIQNWLRIQLHPDLLLPQNESGDMFAQFRNHIAKMLGHFQDLKDSEEILSELLQDILTKIRSILHFNLIIVLDECQFAARELRNSFRSDDWITKRPLLRQIAKCLNDIFLESGVHGSRATFIFTGTGLSKVDITDALSSIVAKAPPCDDVNDTGAFDDIDTLRNYIEGYLPQHVLQSDQFPRLLERIFRWLRGRFTAEYISVVLQNGYKHLDKLLNAYIYNLTGFEPTDYSGEEVISRLITFPTRAFIFETVSDTMKERIKSLCYDYLLRSRLEGWLGDDEDDYIAYGFARVKFSGELKRIRIDEPLVLMACAMWLNGSPGVMGAHSLYKYVANRIQDHNPSTGRNGFEEFICFYLQRVFQTPRRLGQVFDFLDKKSALAQKRATLVTLHIDKVGTKRALGLGIESLDESVSLTDWVKLKSHTAFCFPMNEMGPDIMCFLKLQGDKENPEDFTYICLAVQCKFYQVDGELEPSTLKDAIATVTPKKFFAPRHLVAQVKDEKKAEGREEKRRGLRRCILRALKRLPHRDPLAGKYGVVRIICGFPVKVNLETAFYKHKKQGKTPKYTQDPDEEDHHPLGQLNADLLSTETAHLHPTNLLKVIKGRARKEKKKGKSFWDTFDPAILWSDSEDSEDELPTKTGRRKIADAAEPIEFGSQARMVIEMLDSDYSRSRGLDLPSRPKRKREEMDLDELDIDRSEDEGYKENYRKIEDDSNANYEDDYEDDDDNDYNSD